MVRTCGDANVDAYRVERWCPTIDVEELAGAAVRFVLSEKKAETVRVPNDAIPGYFPGS
jgi:hypothetical protein